MLMLLVLLLLLLLMLRWMHYGSGRSGGASVKTRVGPRTVVRRLTHDRMRMMTLLLAMLMMLGEVDGG